MVSWRAIAVYLFLASSLLGCDQISEQLNKQKSIGRAIGAGCRQSGRSLEDCYGRNPKVSKPDIYAGWKEMSEYMQAKKLDIIPPPPDEPKQEVAEDASGVKASAPSAEQASAASSTENPDKTSTKAPAKH